MYRFVLRETNFVGRRLHDEEEEMRAHDIQWTSILVKLFRIRHVWSMMMMTMVNAIHTCSMLCTQPHIAQNEQPIDICNVSHFSINRFFLRLIFSAVRHHTVALDAAHKNIELERDVRKYILCDSRYVSRMSVQTVRAMESIFLYIWWHCGEMMCDLYNACVRLFYRGKSSGVDRKSESKMLAFVGTCMPVV